MLSALKRLLNPRTPSRRTIEIIYGMIVAQAREPVFYQALNVPDTVNARFDMVVLHLWLILRRLRALEAGGELSQALFDRFCRDMDANLREMGVGDLTVPKRMKKFGEAFYGRTAAYDAVLDQGGDALAEALARNILNSNDAARAAGLAAYVRTADAGLQAIDAAALQDAAWRFPQPEAAA
ncbi:MAG: ubiquinol-cytochrome C chaperone family protein [Xanthobacteraceae bacterium]|nr:ubiquinol-cytochrome C chaperone family protein [Xanthobacteraceae bacterium]